MSGDMLRANRNRRGRPKGSRNRRTIAKEIASLTHPIEIDGKRCQLTTLQALLLTTQRIALGGNTGAAMLLDEYLAPLELNSEVATIRFMRDGPLPPDEWVRLGQLSQKALELHDAGVTASQLRASRGDIGGLGSRNSSSASFNATDEDGK